MSSTLKTTVIAACAALAGYAADGLYSTFKSAAEPTQISCGARLVLPPAQFDNKQQFDQTMSVVRAANEAFEEDSKAQRAAGLPLTVEMALEEGKTITILGVDKDNPSCYLTRKSGPG